MVKRRPIHKAVVLHERTLESSDYRLLIADSWSLIAGHGSLLFGAVFEEIFQFGHEFLDVFEVHVDTGETNVGDFV